ncbi:MAG: hypothetical protein ACD_73C00442G0006 [uncultured bacterium]|nr:MAG: hypothetical protein ACD_73C00442G0006 [uncultured bacterium]
MNKKTGFFFVFFVLFSFKTFALTDKIYKELDTFTQIIQIVDEQYVESIDEKKLIQGAIRGMLETLDPHTIYMAPDMYKEFKSDTSGQFGGVGIEITVKDQMLTVVSPIEDTPAFNSGIKAGDRIVKIDGSSTKEMTLIEAVHKMRGPKGKKVVLTIWHEGLAKPVDIAITRDIIKVESVKYEKLGDGLVFVRIISFQENTSEHLKKFLKQTQDEYGNPLKGIILDLRNNPGGLLTEAIKVSDLFLANGPIVSTKGRDQKTQVNDAKANSVFETVPLVVLVNQGSASASEIVAGAMQDTKRAKVLGTTSFGKGSVQTILEMGDKAGLKITIAKYYTPKGRCIDGKGIFPDIVIGPIQYKKDYPKAKVDEISNEESDESAPATKGKPPTLQEYQKQKAIEIFKKSL